MASQYICCPAQLLPLPHEAIDPPQPSGRLTPHVACIDSQVAGLHSQRNETTSQTPQSQVPHDARVPPHPSGTPVPQLVPSSAHVLGMHVPASISITPPASGGPASRFPASPFVGHASPRSTQTPSRQS